MFEKSFFQGSYQDISGHCRTLSDIAGHWASGMYYLCIVIPENTQSFIIHNLKLILKNMARSVTYSVVPRMKPGDKNLPPKYYAQAQARGDVNIREMAERIQSTCTVHKSDVYAVLVALEDVVAEAIQNGEIVRLGDLCTLQVGLSGKGALTEEDYNENLIKRAKINFRPGKVLAGALETLSFSKVPVKYVKEAEEEDNSGFEE
jgi:predicted histone-like DNA-binding protein